MPVKILPIFFVLMAGCATTPAAQMSKEAPFKTYESTKQPSEIASCIASTVPGGSVIPGDNVWIASVRDIYERQIFTWRIERTGSGSKISVWRMNGIAPGLNRAERCF